MSENSNSLLKVTPGKKLEPALEVGDIGLELTAIQSCLEKRLVNIAKLHTRDLMERIISSKKIPEVDKQALIKNLEALISNHKGS